MLGQHRDAIVVAAIFGGFGGWIADPVWAALIAGAIAGVFMFFADWFGQWADSRKQDAG